MASFPQSPFELQNLDIGPPVEEQRPAVLDIGSPVGVAPTGTLEGQPRAPELDIDAPVLSEKEARERFNQFIAQLGSSQAFLQAPLKANIEVLRFLLPEVFKDFTDSELADFVQTVKNPSLKALPDEKQRNIIQRAADFLAGPFALERAATGLTPLQAELNANLLPNQRSTNVYGESKAETLFALAFPAAVRLNDLYRKFIGQNPNFAQALQLSTVEFATPLNLLLTGVSMLGRTLHLLARPTLLRAVEAERAVMQLKAIQAPTEVINSAIAAFNAARKPAEVAAVVSRIGRTADFLTVAGSLGIGAPQAIRAAKLAIETGGEEGVPEAIVSGSLTALGVFAARRLSRGLTQPLSGELDLLKVRLALPPAPEQRISLTIGNPRFADSNIKVTEAQAITFIEQITPDDITVVRIPDADYAYVTAKTEVGPLAAIVPDTIFTPTVNQLRAAKELGVVARTIPRSVLDAQERVAAHRYIRQYFAIPVDDGLVTAVKPPVQLSPKVTVPEEISFTTEATDTGFTVRALRDGREPIGQIDIANEGAQARVDFAFVNEAFRGKSIGTRLYQEAAAEAQRRYFDELVSDFRRGTTDDARKVWKRIGGEEVEGGFRLRLRGGEEPIQSAINDLAVMLGTREQAAQVSANLRRLMSSKAFKKIDLRAQNMLKEELDNIRKVLPDDEADDLLRIQRNKDGNIVKTPDTPGPKTTEQYIEALQELLPNEARPGVIGSAFRRFSGENPWSPFASGEEILRGYGAPGSFLSEALLVWRREHTILSGQWSFRVRQATAGLSKAEVDNMISVLEGQASPVNDRVAKAANIVRGVFDEVAERAQKAKVRIVGPDGGDEATFTPRRNFFPHRFDRSFFEDEAKIRQVTKQLVDSGEFDSIAEAREFWLTRVRPNSENLASNLQFQRIANLSGYRRDLAVIEEYLQSAAAKIREVEMFGPPTKNGTPQVINHMIGEIRREFGDKGGDVALMLAKGHLGQPLFSVVAGEVTKKMLSFSNATLLSLAAINNATQFTFTALVTGIRNFIRALPARFGNLKASSELAQQFGAINESLLRQMQREYGIAADSLGGTVLRRTGFSLFDKNNNIFSAVAGELLVEDSYRRLLADPHNQALRRSVQRFLGLNPDKLIAEGPTFRNRAIGAVTLAERTQFRFGALDLPPVFRSSDLGRLLFLYKSFLFQSSKLIKDAVVREAARGNFAPLLPLMTIIPMAGAFAMETRNFVSGRPRKNTIQDYILDAYAHSGALGIGIEIQRILESEADAGRQAVSFAAGPVFGAVGEAVQIAATPERTPEIVTRRIPVLGPAISRALQEKRKAKQEAQRALAGRR